MEPDSATKTTDSHSGSYALQLQNVVTMWNDTTGYITNGTMGSSGPTGGTPLTQNPDTLSFYYKYSPVGHDTAILYVFTTSYDTITHTSSPVEVYLLKLPAQSNYTKMTVPFYYAGFPPVDTINLTFCSGNIINTNAWVGLGSTLKVDDINLTYKAGITNLAMIMPSGNINFCNGTANQHITIMLKNTGNTMIQSGQVIDIYNKIDTNQVVFETDSLTSNWLPNDSLFYTFSHTTNLSSPGQHTYKFYLHYQNDTIHLNHTTSGIATETFSKLRSISSREIQYTYIHSTFRIL